MAIEVEQSVTLAKPDDGTNCIRLTRVPAGVKIEYVGFQFGGPTVSLSDLTEAVAALNGS